jgi:hypothetical protein
MNAYVLIGLIIALLFLFRNQIADYLNKNAGGTSQGGL